MPISGRRLLPLLCCSLILAGTTILLVPAPSQSTVVVRSIPSPTAKSVPHDRHDFGKVLTRVGMTLDCTFTIRNNELEAIELDGLRGDPPCCVAMEAVTPVRKILKPGETCRIKMRIRPAPVAGRVAWRGIVATAARRQPFILEAAAELVPIIVAGLNNEVPLEIESGAAATREGYVQFVGGATPPAVTAAASAPDVHLSVGRFTDSNVLEGTTFRIWRAPIIISVDPCPPGTHSAVLRVSSKTSGEYASLPLQWIVRSAWVVEPKSLVLGVGERQGRFRVTPRRKPFDARPTIEGPAGMPVTIEAKPLGFELVVDRPSKAEKTLETFKLKLGAETIALSVMFLQTDDAVGEAKP